MSDDPGTPAQSCALGEDESCETGWRRHFAHPEGWLGALVGHLMAVKNRERGEWLVRLLDVQPSDRVLEVGFGPGVDVARIARLAPRGRVAGVDPSAVMLAQARRRNAEAVREGRVDLRLAEATKLPFADASFDRAISTNNLQFWRSVEEGLAEIRRVLVPGGRALVAIQPRSAGATEATTRAWEKRLVDAFSRAGFHDVESQIHAMRPVPLAAVTGTRP
jgi:ubiquinone/menaquinone biosynthesis C-methylase UbiE